MTERTWQYAASDLPKLSPFGSVLHQRMPIARFVDGTWTEPELIELSEFAVHPGAHGIHYGSSCFEGLKAYRHADDAVAIFRWEQHAERMIQSARTLRLHEPPVELFQRMTADVVKAAISQVPPSPGSLYLRPVLLGIDENIGAAASPSRSAAFYVLASPVGDYFAGGERALRLLVEDQAPRTTPQFGRVKTGANYAAALGITLDAKEKWQIDQILFCPSGDVQETGASNFLLIDDERVITKQLTNSFLHGVTRSSVLTIARDLGYTVEERDFTVEELLAWTEHGEAALSGTAAVLAGVGSLIHNEKEYVLSGNATGKNTSRLRKALVEIQHGIAPDPHSWLTKVL